MKNAIATVSLNVGEASFPLASDINAICDLEAEFGEGINQIIARFQNAELLRMTDVRRYLRVMLRSNEKPMEIQQADDICAIAGIHTCSAAVTDHILSMFRKD